MKFALDVERMLSASHNHSACSRFASLVSVRDVDFLVASLGEDATA